MPELSGRRIFFVLSNCIKYYMMPRLGAKVLLSPHSGPVAVDAADRSPAPIRGSASGNGTYSL